MPDFLLEVLVEEIPARLQSNAISEFEKSITSEFDRLKIGYERVRSFISPRRIVFSADLDEKTREFSEEKKGPQITAPTGVIEKFLQANNVSREDCIERNIDKKTFIFIEKHYPSQETLLLLPEIIRKTLINMSWRKSMRWGSFQTRFVRPIRNILAVFNGKTIDSGVPEIGLHFTNQTIGHRFMLPSRFSVLDFDDYSKKLKEHFVIVDRNERQRIISEEIKKIEKDLNLSVEIPEDLMEEVVGLTEYPVALVGKIPQKFMRLPNEVIITPMKVHQRYFPTHSADGNLAPYFVFVANNLAADEGKIIIRGNERVLNARLEDALFFFETDLKNPLESHLDSLRKIVFNEKLGTVFDRINRVASLCRFTCEELRKRNSLINDETENLLVRAATLSKCDLSTTMVGEFPELQGIMGAHYARIQGENEVVCQALREQYNQGGDFTSYFSALFSLVDKIEIITSLFAIGKEPSGSKDPFALRRVAIGVLKVIKNFQLEIDLKVLVEKSFLLLPDDVKNSESREIITKKILAFIAERLKVLLKDSGVSHEIASAMVKTHDDVLSICRKSFILNEILQTPQGEKLILSCKRAKNIIADNTDENVDEALCSEAEETDLLRAIECLEKKISQETDFSKNLSNCIELEGSVSRFFDKVLVNTDDIRKKQNRLNILTRMLNLFRRVIPIDIGSSSESSVIHKS